MCNEFAPDVEKGPFRPGLRVRGVQGAPGAFEMTWAPDGRATGLYGAEQVSGKPHVIWRRVGTPFSIPVRRDPLNCRQAPTSRWEPSRQVGPGLRLRSQPFLRNASLAL